MRIMVSACLVGENCKYNGGNNRNEELLNLLSGHEVIAVCPEVLGGLPTPRQPSELRDGRVISRNGQDVDAAFRLGAEKCLAIARKEEPDLIIFQSRSPSCGVKQRYDGSFSGKLEAGAGVTAELLLRDGFSVLDIGDKEQIRAKISDVQELQHAFEHS
jgi:uncharacterized protein YbbK (DUF523 family)